MTLSASADIHRTPAVTCADVADTRRNAHTIRVPEEGLWEEFEQAVGRVAPSVVLRDFMAWYVRRPKAQLPQRPPKD